MPYIPDERRTRFDQQVDALIAALGAAGWVEGDLNYCLSRVLGAAFEAEMRYHTSPRVRGVLQDVCDEFYRRVVGKYEDAAIEKNGDIPEYARLSVEIAARRLKHAMESSIKETASTRPMPEEKK